MIQIKNGKTCVNPFLEKIITAMHEEIPDYIAGRELNWYRSSYDYDIAVVEWHTIYAKKPPKRIGPFNLSFFRLSEPLLVFRYHSVEVYAPEIVGSIKKILEQEGLGSTYPAIICKSLSERELAEYNK